MANPPQVARTKVPTPGPLSTTPGESSHLRGVTPVAERRSRSRLTWSGSGVRLREVLVYGVAVYVSVSTGRRLAWVASRDHSRTLSEPLAADSRSVTVESAYVASAEASSVTV